MKTLVTAVAFLIAGTAAAQNLPEIRPGESCEKLRARYGSESSLQDAAHTWKQGALTIIVMVRPNGPCVADEIQYYADPGHVFRTRDGILLGKDTMVSANAKLRGHNDTTYLSIRGEGKAYGEIEVPPTSAFPFKETYCWQLNSAAAEKLHALPKRTDFSDEPVVIYYVDYPDPR